MFKKKLLTLACAVFCAAIVTAQTPVSRVNAATAGLIEDGVIDSLAFGNEEGNGVIFGQYTSNNNLIELGWGNALSDTLWLSVYDGFTMWGYEKSTETVTKTYKTSDGVKVDYVDEERNLSSAYNNTTYNDVWFKNVLGVGVGINNTFGVQAVWSADWDNYTDKAVQLDPNGGFKVNVNGVTQFTPDVKHENADSSTGKTTSEAYENIKNYTRNNTITFNFKGAGIENDGEVPFWVKLNKVYSALNFEAFGNDYSNSTKYLGQTIYSDSANGLYEKTTIRPGITGEVGFNLKEWGVAKPSVTIEEDFNIGFVIEKTNTSYKTSFDNDNDGNYGKWTETVDYEVTPGSRLDWKNTLTPKFGLDFDLDEKLTLKTEVSAAVGVAMLNTETATFTRTRTQKWQSKSDFLYYTNTKITEEGAVGNGQNVNQFSTSVTPDFKLGLVYQVIPGKTNINFGVDVAPGAYSWTVTDTTNSNINTVTTTTDKDFIGNTTKSKDVTIANNNTESREVLFENGGTAAIFNIGATWFFTENAKLDVWYQNNFTSLFSDSNKFGVDFSVMF